jgi:hypothetical protein
MPPIEAPLWNPTCKIKINVHPWIIVYIQGSSTLCKPYGIKPTCNWEHLGERFGNLGTNWVHEKNRKIPNVFQNHCVPNMFHNFPMCSPEQLNLSHNLCPKIIFLYIRWAKIYNFTYPGWELLVGVVSKLSDFICDGPVKEAHCKKY